MLYANLAKQKKLMEATLVIQDHVEEKLPVGFELALVMTSEETFIGLYDRNGERVEIQYEANNISSIDKACVTAIELHRTQSN